MKDPRSSPIVSLITSSSENYNIQEINNEEVNFDRTAFDHYSRNALYSNWFKVLIFDNHETYMSSLPMNEYNSKICEILHLQVARLIELKL